MKRFVRLYAQLDQTTRTGEKQAALEAYFREEEPRDAAWALTILAGQPVRRALSSGVLHRAAAEATGHPAWLIEACREHVGDTGETIALLLPTPQRPREVPLHDVIERFLLPMRRADEAGRVALLREAWDELGAEERLVLHKLASGTFRVGAARGVLVRALASIAGVETGEMAHRLMGDVPPTTATLRRVLMAPGQAPDAASEHVPQTQRPYPFCLAHALEGMPEELGPATGWIAEWKWDGIRAQLHRARGRGWLFSRGEEAIEAQFPELVALAALLPEGTVLDGEVLAWRFAPHQRPLPFARLQRRLQRKGVQPTLFDEEGVVFMAFDLIEHAGQDVRAMAWHARRALLEATVAPLLVGEARLRLSPAMRLTNWANAAELRQQAEREGQAEGLMLKAVDGIYHVGRTRAGTGASADAPAHRGEESDSGDALEEPAPLERASELARARAAGGWWKWKLDPFTIDAVLIASQPGSGRRAGLFTDHTFALWHEGALVPIAKAYAGLTDEEMARVDAFVRAHTLRRAGPVRFVEPVMVFELGFQDVAASSRHKSGVALRFPRMLRWRTDKPAQQADALATLLALARGRG